MGGTLFNPVNWVNATITALEWLKSQIKEVFIVLVISTLTFVLWPGWLIRLVPNPARVHRITGYALTACVLYVVVFGGAALWRNVERWFRLRNLGIDEKSVLKQFVESGSLSRCFQPGETGTASLEAEGILAYVKKASECFDEHLLCYRVRPWIFRKLKKKPVLLT